VGAWKMGLGLLQHWSPMASILDRAFLPNTFPHTLLPFKNINKKIRK
jgi:hypothetical protein